MSKKISLSTVVNTGGREGESKSVTGYLNVKTTQTKKEGYTNPEELFAAGLTACFNGAMSFPLERDGLGDKVRTVRAEVSLLGDLPDFTTLHLAVTLIGHIDGLSKEDTLKYMKETEDICPYTKAIKGNVEITFDAE
ncbi:MULTISPECIES: Ohr family peroxiredoxin [Enterococcus]|uniref:Organic hydroperoxide resistance protein n=1 Tax=Enterococcus diestrammenae TaxID=1155073 RepID=A0ABV0EXZ1_9ENTE|nr:Ohr family peroxiredoxin [Enterococcus diestrammenae]KAF1299042.1 organic hydroperoxide resistance protein [Enterococcus diestrammenae]HIX69808.1 Ohr family peroxiredoxin [Candidatus Enterococcus stercoravium]